MKNLQAQPTWVLNNCSKIRLFPWEDNRELEARVKQAQRELRRRRNLIKSTSLDADHINPTSLDATNLND